MKKMKKMIALLLAMVMVLAMGVTVSAEETTKYSITITNPHPDTMSIVGKIYTAYKLFDVTYSGSNYAYSIKTTNPFYSNSGAKAVLDTYFEFTTIASDDTTMSVTVKENMKDSESKTLSAANVRKLADALQPYATGNGAGIATATEESVTIDLSEAGYYIVTGTVKPADPVNTEEVVSAVILDNATPTATVKPKASIPTLDKKITGVKEGTTAVNDALLDTAGQAAVAKVGSTVSYELDSIVPDLTGYTDYTFTFSDTITKGLDYVTDDRGKLKFKLTINGTEITDSTPIFAGDKRSFTLTIPYATLELYATGSAIVLTYDATVNSDSLSYDYVNNTAKLTYSNSPYTSDTNDTPNKKTYVININLDVNKVAENQDKTQTLAKAEFILYREITVALESGDEGYDSNQNGTKVVKQYYKWDNNVVTWVTEDDAEKFTTNDSGNLIQQICGLDKGTYYLVETKAPAGYNLLKDPVEITISVSEKDGKVTYTSNTSDITNNTIDLTGAQNENQPVATQTIINKTGPQLPATGGMGTKLFYVLGTILVLGAGVLLITKRRMSK